MASIKVKTAQQGEPRQDSYRYAVTPGEEGPIKKRQKGFHDMEQLKQDLEMDEHKVPITELFGRLQTDPNTGLDPQHARSMLMRDGPNELTRMSTTPEWIRLAKQLFGGFSILIWSAALLSFITYAIQASQLAYAPGDNLYLGIVLTAVVLCSGAFSYYQESRGQRILDTFEEKIPHYVLCVRNGLYLRLRAAELVVGDIVDVKAGDRVPADMRIIASQGFKVDNSLLTGQTEPQVRNPDFTHENPLETQNLAFFGTDATEGTCRGLVVEVGDQTVMGRIANLASGVDIAETALAKEITHIIHIMSFAAIMFGTFYFIVAFMLGYFWMDAVLFFIGVVLANVPEGLLVTVMLALTLSAQRMVNKNCLVKNLDAVETLGLASIILTDKTGVLTQNRMTVTNMWFDGNIIEADTSVNQRNASYSRNDPTWLGMSRVAMLCNNARFRTGSDEQSIMHRECTGDAAEIALLKCTELSIGDVDGFRRKNRKICEIPFTPSNKFQVSVHETEDRNDPRTLLVMKGAPEIVVEKCSTYMRNGNEFHVDDNFRQAFNMAYAELGERGEHVLGFCDYVLPLDQYPPGYEYDADDANFPLKGLRFLGLMSMVDPARVTVPNAVGRCKDAQVHVIMVTGDHPVTAKAFAKNIGLFSMVSKTVEDIAADRGIPPEEVDPADATAAVIHGDDLREMTPYQVDEMLDQYAEIVFARTAPHQKRIIVEGCQRLGKVVAVTGNGVTDSGALRLADIGIAMGNSGSDVSRQSADVILLDDSFSSIVAGIEEGRLVFENLQKMVLYTFASNIPEILPFVAFLVFDVPLPMGLMTILCIDLGTEVLPALSLIYEVPESRLMHKKPRDPTTEPLVNERLVSLSYGQIGMVQGLAGLFTYLIVMAENGFWYTRLVGLRNQWDSLAVNDVQDSFGQEWTYFQRKKLEFEGYTAFFIAIVICQLTNLLACKTKKLSIFQHGIRNHHVTFALFFSLGLGTFLVYCPGLDKGLRMANMRWTWWFPSLPFAIAIFFYEELRKILLRNFSLDSLVAREFQY